jgi:hypothetical protein
MPGDQQQAAQVEEECGWCKFMKAGPCRTVFEVRSDGHGKPFLHMQQLFW